MDSLEEKEAAWLGTALLVPEPVALFVARRRLPVADTDERHDVSEGIMRWCLNASGVLKRAGHERRKASSR